MFKNSKAQANTIQQIFSVGLLVFGLYLSWTCAITPFLAFFLGFVFNCEVMVKKYRDLKIENAQLKKDNFVLEKVNGVQKNLLKNFLK